MFLTLCFPIPMIKCSNNQWCASIKDLMFVIYLQLHNVIVEIFTFQQLLCNVSFIGVYLAAILNIPCSYMMSN